MYKGDLQSLDILWKVTVFNNAKLKNELSWRMTHTNTSGVLKYKGIAKSRPDENTWTLPESSKNVVVYEGNSNINYRLSTRNNPQESKKEKMDLENWWKIKTITAEIS